MFGKTAGKFDLSKFQDGYEVAVKELVEAKIKHLPVPVDEVPQKAAPSNVINLMDALRKSIGSEAAPAKSAKKPPMSEKEAAPRKGIGLIKSPAKTTAKRKTA